VDPKSGLKTTELWTAVLGAIGLAVPSLLAALGNRPWVATILGVAGTVLPAVYVWGRAILKAELAKQTQVLPDSWDGPLSRALDVVEALATALPKVAAAAATSSASTAPAAASSASAAPAASTDGSTPAGAAASTADLTRG
jgi:hypothetical protein